MNLIEAIAQENIEEVRRLIAAGANVNEEFFDYLTSPLISAVLTNNYEIVALLIEAHADVNQKVKGSYPLHCAAKYNFTEIIELLLKNGAEIDSLDEMKRTPLHIAAQYNNLSTAKILLEAGANPNAVDIYGITPTYTAIKWNQDQLEIIKELVSHGADINIYVPRYNSLINMALQFNREKTFDFLIEQGLDINAPDENGRTPLHNALYSRKTIIAKKLIDRGADVTLVNKAGWTPLIEAIFSCHIENTKMLILAEANNSIPYQRPSEELFIRMTKSTQKSIYDSDDFDLKSCGKDDITKMKEFIESLSHFEDDIISFLQTAKKSHAACHQARQDENNKIFPAIPSEIINHILYYLSPEPELGFKTSEALVKSAIIKKERILAKVGKPAKEVLGKFTGEIVESCNNLSISNSRN